MRRLAHLRMMVRVSRDIRRCARFLEETSGGKPTDFERDIATACERICELPESRPIEARRRHTGLELRRYNMRQFAIVYAYFRPTQTLPQGIVSIRAVKHWRVRNVFLGVREIDAPAGDELRTSDHRTV